MNILKTTSKKQSIVVSYLTIALNTVTSLVLTPFLLNKLGAEQYGLYQMIYSVAAYILILDLGISSTMVRYITEFRERNEREREANFNAMMLTFILAIMILVFIIGGIVNFNIEKIYTKLSQNEYEISHKVFCIMIAQIILTICTHYVEGLILSRERFLFVKIVQLVKIILAFIFTILMVSVRSNIIGIVIANTAALFLTMLMELLYVIRYLDIKIKYRYFDWVIFKPALGLMVAMLIQSVIGHVNTTVDKTILGIMCTKHDVTVYSIAASIITMFNAIPSVIASVFLPQATRLIINNANDEELTEFVIRPGRWQLAIIFPVLLVFILYGEEFISLWAGNDMTGAWLVCIIIMIPNMIPLVQNVCLSILDAKNKRLVRSLTLFGIAFINVILSIILVRHIGFLGAPIGTAISYIVGHIILMNIYYKKVVGLDVIRMFKEIGSRTWICALVSFLLSIPLTMININGLIPFIIKCGVFCIVYCILMILWGFSEEEKRILFNFIKRK